jgi:undecaprenyl-diphosphatase
VLLGRRRTALVAASLAGAAFVVLLVLVVARWSPLIRLDRRIALSLNERFVDQPGVVHLLRIVSAVGSPAVFNSLAGVLAILLLLRRMPRLAVWLIVAVPIAGLANLGVKAAVHRPRPVLPHHLASARGWSFPSGHAVGATVGVGALVLLVSVFTAVAVWRVCLGVGVAIVALVGFSRVGLGVHYLSDVVGGVLFGLTWLALVTATIRPPVGAYSPLRSRANQPAASRKSSFPVPGRRPGGTPSARG